MRWLPSSGGGNHPLRRLGGVSASNSDFALDDLVRGGRRFSFRSNTFRVSTGTELPRVLWNIKRRPEFAGFSRGFADDFTYAWLAPATKDCSDIRLLKCLCQTEDEKPRGAPQGGGVVPRPGNLRLVRR
jgi:hypothetical protein